MTVESARTPDLDVINRSIWSTDSVLSEYVGSADLATLDSWSDAGEQAALTAVARTARGAATLDIGVGSGRTTTLLKLITDDYRAIDYTPEMVAACAQRHPGVEVSHGDARDLTRFADGSFGLVVFSYNGLDAVGHDDRGIALAEIARVMRPGAAFQFSSLNLDGPCRRATPWRQAGSQLAHTWTPAYRAGFAAMRMIQAPLRMPRTVRNFRRLSGEVATGDGWALAPMEAHDFGLLVHYTTLAALEQELRSVGLRLEVAFDAEYGSRVSAADDLSGVRYFQVVARKP